MSIEPSSPDTYSIYRRCTPRHSTCNTAYQRSQESLFDICSKAMKEVNQAMAASPDLKPRAKLKRGLEMGNKRMCIEALKEGANPNIQIDGRSPLHYAAKINSLTLAKLAVEKGALLQNASRKGRRKGETALHAYLRNVDKGVCNFRASFFDYLLQICSSPRQVNGKGQSYLSLMVHSLLKREECPLEKRHFDWFFQGDRVPVDELQSLMREVCEKIRARKNQPKKSPVDLVKVIPILQDCLRVLPQGELSNFVREILTDTTNTLLTKVLLALLDEPFPIEDLQNLKEKTHNSASLLTEVFRRVPQAPRQRQVALSLLELRLEAEKKTGRTYKKDLTFDRILEALQYRPDLACYAFMLMAADEETGEFVLSGEERATITLSLMTPHQVRNCKKIFEGIRDQTPEFLELLPEAFEKKNLIQWKN